LKDGAWPCPFLEAEYIKVRMQMAVKARCNLWSTRRKDHLVYLEVTGRWAIKLAHMAFWSAKGNGQEPETAEIEIGICFWFAFVPRDQP